VATEQNIFLAGRLADDEDQLTEMLAWLVTVVPEAGRALCELATGVTRLANGAPRVSTQYGISHGRLDALLELEDLVVVVESKLTAVYGPDQLRKYIDWLSKRQDERRVLMTLTASRAPWPATDVRRAAKLGIGVAQKRWEQLSSALDATLDSLSGLPERLVREFIEMLIEEGLIPMAPLNALELGHVWAESTERIWRYHSFFTACIDAIEETLGMTRQRGKSAQIDYIYQSFITQPAEVLYVGIDATDVGNPLPAKAARNVPVLWLAVDAANWRDWNSAGRKRLEAHSLNGWRPNESRRWDYAPQVWRYLDEVIGQAPFDQQEARLAQACRVGAEWIADCRPGRRKISS
jgi:hypothetical protein